MRFGATLGLTSIVPLVLRVVLHDELVEVMGVLNAIKTRTYATERIFDPLRAKLAMLPSINQISGKVSWGGISPLAP